MDSGVPLLATESTAESRVMHRRRPLHTCGISALAIARIFYSKVRDFSGPIGSISRKTAACFSSAFPLIYAIQNQGLAFLSFADDHILVIENTVESFFPPSTYLFNKIDKLLLIAEALPGKFDDALDKFPTIIHKVPFLNSATVHLISWLNILVSRLTRWGSNNTSEKEIMIDMNFDNPNRDKSEAIEFIAKSYASEDQAMTVGEDVEKSSPRSCSPSYKEMLEGESKDIEELKDTNAVEENPQATACDSVEVEQDIENSANRKNEDSSGRDDLILELFETSWHMNPGKGSKGSLFPHSASDS